MSSLLTNNSAMVALQTLKTINKNMGEVQNQISTGKRIANARDNAALWGISTTMQTDVTGFKAISESLSLGSATLTVARDGAETITSLLDQMKGKIVAAQEENVDRNKIQSDINALIRQIDTVVSAAQFNGLNVLQGNDAEGATNDVNILASLNRTLGADGQYTVSPDNITFQRQELRSTVALWGENGAIAGTPITAPVAALDNTAPATVTMTMAAITGTDLATATSGSVQLSMTVNSVDVAFSVAHDAMDATGVAAAALARIDAMLAAGELSGFTVAAGGAAGELDFTSTDPFAAVSTTPVVFGANDLEGGTAEATGIAVSTGVTLAARAQNIEFAGRPVAAGDGYRITIADAGGVDRAFEYIAARGDTMNDVIQSLQTQIETAAAAPGSTLANVQLAYTPVDDPSTGTLNLQIFNNSAVAISATGETSTGGQRLGLYGLHTIDVTQEGGPGRALREIETHIQTAIDAAAAFGSAQGRIQTQTEYVGKIMDSLTSGIGVLVDADMEAASARLQALQVQQQLGIQALSIANQQPQNILALFR